MSMESLARIAYHAGMNAPQPTDLSAPVRYCQIDADHCGQRIDNYLLHQLKGVPKSVIYRLLRKGEIRVNKGRIKPHYRLQMGDQLRIAPVRLPQVDSPKLCLSPKRATALRQRLIYEDDSLIALNKPSGLAVHGGSGIQAGLIEQFRTLSPQYAKLELVHRLDRDTSGVLLLAKQPRVLKAMHELFRQGQVHKEYLCLVHGQWPEQRVQVNAPLLRFHLPSGERRVRVDAQGKPSCTLYQVLHSTAEYSLLTVRLLSGRTHQIRVHCQHVGHPVAGDAKYCPSAVYQHSQQQGLMRLFLHAHQLKFVHPDTGQTLCLTQPLAQELDEFLQHLGMV